MSDDGERLARGPGIEPLLWGLGCLLLYGALASPAFYKTDGPDIVRLFDAHHKTGEPLSHPWHVGYLPLLEGFRRLLSWVGLHPGYLRLGDWFSAAGAALGVAAARAGMRRLAIGAATARLATAALALSPGTLLFATVVEFHGPLLGFVGVCFWWTAVQVQRPTWWGMVVLGALSHGAFLVDGQALFLPAWTLSFFVARRWPAGELRRDLGRAVVAGSVHSVLFLVLPRLFPGFYRFWADLGAGLHEEGSIGRPQSFDWSGTILLQEWLAPLLPVSVAVFLAPLRRALRLEFLAFVVGFLPFFAICVRQLVFEPEYGAYLLPLVLPASLLCAQACPARLRRPAFLLLLAGLVPWFGPSRAHLREQEAVDAAFAASVQEAAGGAKPFVLVGSARELASAYARLQPDELLWVREDATMEPALATPERLAGVGAFLGALHAGGRAVLLTEGALASLDDPRAAMLAEKATLHVESNDHYAGPRFASFLREHFEMRSAGKGMLRLAPKP